ncbi:MAG: hypothetical protein QXL88_01705 [Candidatus Pacearchaeota archaeon]
MKAKIIIPIVVVIALIILAVLLLPKKAVLTDDIKTSVNEINAGILEADSLNALTADEFDAIDSDMQEIESLTELF